ncbi:unnamed protein product [Mucor hiemalis]
MKVAFQNVKGKKKRGPGVDVNLSSLFAAAKAEDTIITESWNTLGTSATTISRQLRERSENNVQPDNMEPENATAEEAISDEDLNEENSTTNIMTQQAQPDDYVLENGFNISTHFRQFNLESNKKSKESGFYIDRDLHQILSLSHVLLLKENEHDGRLVKSFGLENLNTLHKNLLQKYVDKDSVMETTTFNSIVSALRGLNSNSERRSFKEQINDVAKLANNKDYKMIDILINCLNKLPNQERLEDDIREAELTGTFLDPVLNPIFHDPENNRLFRWLNTGVDDTESLRPDGNVFELEQRRIKFSTGYVEVKPDKSRSDTLKTHEDLLRLVNFCKDTLDKKDVKSMIAVQAVGFYVTIYLFSLEATGLYLLTELYSFNVPKSISELPQFVMHFDEIKRIMACYQENCVLANDIHNKSRKRMSIQQQNTRSILNIKKPRKLRSSIAFK